MVKSFFSGWFAGTLGLVLFGLGAGGGGSSSRYMTLYMEGRTYSGFLTRRD